MPGGDVIDAGLKDLAGARATPQSLAVSVAAPRLRREGVPVTTSLPEPEFRLYELLEGTEGELAHARYMRCCAGWSPSPTPVDSPDSIRDGIEKKPHT